MNCRFVRLSTLTAAAMLSVMMFGGRAMADTVQVCNASTPLQHNDPKSGMSTNLLVDGTCAVGAGSYYFHNVNIYAKDPSTCAATPSSCGSLVFSDASAVTNFYAENIIVENGGSLIAGSPSNPIGKSGGQLTIYLWGAAKDPGAVCRPGSQCGIPNAIWTSNTYATNMDPKSCNLQTLGNGVTDCFYPYKSIDEAGQGTDAYFGHKVLAVSYGGTLKMFGSKGAIFPGATTPCTESDPSCSGTSWARLDGDLTPGMTTLKVDRAVDWQAGDHIVVTTTDYLPGHSEELEIVGNPIVQGDTTTITFKNTNANVTGVEWPHNGESIDLSNASFADISRLDLNITKADTRAAVGLLSRSIRIVSMGDTPSQPFPAPPEAGSKTPGYYFGGHTIVRQGFDQYQVQGVEFRDLGQGGEKMHYPVHFHMDRQVPQNTFVKDCSIWTSMTRWIVIHGTQGVLLARNVGYKSIGSGFYLEDGTETGNKLYSNLGIFARAAVANVQNPRSVPGILTANDPKCNARHGELGGECHSGYDNFPFYSDSNHPSVFWIMNGMNDFDYNFAAGAATCGACYWFVPGAISGPSREEKWFGYASEQRSVIPNPDESDLGYDERSGTTPLESFEGNTCVAAMNSFQEVGNTSVCNGVNFVTNGAKPDTTLLMLPSKQAIDNFPQTQAKAGLHGPNRATDTYWPIVNGSRRATRCPGVDAGNPNADCSQVPICGNTGSARNNCDVVVLNKYTTSFNWAQKNFAAIWMRPFWSLIINSVITDPQSAGINFVTSGDYSKSAVPDGYWSLARKDVFIGSTQWQNPENKTLEDNPYASNAGPFNPFQATYGTTTQTGLKCAGDPYSGGINNLYCLSKNDGISMQLEAYTNFQRLFSVYDGPAYQDSNAYLNIQPTYLTSNGTLSGTQLPGCKPHACGGARDCNPCANVGIMSGGNFGIRADLKDDLCYLPNAAIGWKQSNGFYYSPAFHSTNLYFNRVPIRHFVTEPLFEPGLLDFKTDLKEARQEYCRWQFNMFDAFTDIDRETVLNDDDGTLTGLTSPLPTTHETISVNKEPFFNAPSETPECASDLPLTGNAKCPPNTAKTSPYEYLTAAIYPECGLTPSPATNERSFAACLHNNEVVWGQPCTESPLGSDKQGCVGVPIYRQLLLHNEKKGLAQMKRMMGQGTFQRSALTVNHGIYYVDTTVSREEQKRAGAKSLNVFEAGQKYDLYFLYAKPDTVQTYQLFVGKHDDTKDDPDFAKNNVKFGYMNIDTIKYRFKEAKPPGSGTELGQLPEGWKSEYNDNTGILTLTTNMESLKSEFDFTTNIPGSDPPEPLGADRCKPATMCTWANNQCSCNPSSPYYSLCQQTNPQGQTICSWSVKDIDCPAEGCPAFQITFPKHFKANGERERPEPAEFDYANGGNSTPFNWEIGFNLEASDISGSDCHYDQQPPPSCTQSQGLTRQKHQGLQSQGSQGMSY